MNRRLVIMTSIIAALLAALPIAWGASRLSNAQTQFDQANRALMMAQHAADRLTALESQDARVGLEAQPTDDVQTPLVTILTDIALDARLFRSISESENVALDDGQHRRQSMLVQFNPMTLADLGALLAAWRDREPAWMPSRIVLSAPTRRRGTEGQFTVQLTLTSIYLEAGTSE